MKDFCEALQSGKRSAVIPEEDDYFGKLIGSWRIAYKDNATGTDEKENGIFQGCWKEWQYRM